MTASSLGSMARRRSCYGCLPEEIVFEILSRLPVKSLVRLKSVCKLWRFIISDNIFTQTHLTNSHAVVLNYRSDIFDYNCIEVHDTHQDSVKLYMLPPSEARIEYINSCNGLVCLSNEGSDVIYIWNPATKRFKKLPTPSKDFSNVYYVNLAGKRKKVRVFLGFGFDPISNDYKLVRIVFKNRFGSADCKLPKAEMYSANTDSWKEIQIPESLRRYWSRSKLFHAKTGLLYIECCSGLLALDLHSEVFRLYPFPCSLSRMSEVLDYQGYAAMIFESTDGSVSLYKLDDDDDVCAEVSWTKMFNLEADSKIIWVTNYLGNGQFVVAKRRSFCIYDYKNRESKTILLLSPADGMRSPVKYTESLVSLDGFKKQEELRGVHLDIDLTHRRKEVLDIVEEIIKKGSTEEQVNLQAERALACTIFDYLYGTIDKSKKYVAMAMTATR